MRLRFMALFFFIFPSGYALAGPVECDWVIREAQKRGRAEPDYMVGREIDDYNLIFNPGGRLAKMTPSKAIAELSPGDVVFEPGAGQARVLTSIAESAPESVTLVALGLSRPNYTPLKKALKGHKNLVYLSGLPLEVRFEDGSLDSYKGKAAIVFDVFASGTYGLNPFETFVMEAAMLKKGGYLFTQIPLRMHTGAASTHGQILLELDFRSKGAKFDSIENVITDSIYYPSTENKQTVRRVKTWLGHVSGIEIVDTFVKTDSGIEYLAIIARRTTGPLKAHKTDTLEYFENIPPIRHYRCSSCN